MKILTPQDKVYIDFIKTGYGNCMYHSLSCDICKLYNICRYDISLNGRNIPQMREKSKELLLKKFTEEELLEILI